MKALDLFKQVVLPVLKSRGYSVEYTEIKKKSDPWGDLISIKIEGEKKCAYLNFYSQGFLSIDVSELDESGNVIGDTIKTLLFEPNEDSRQEIALKGLLDFLI